jgi:hypothetical protein
LGEEKKDNNTGSNFPENNGQAKPNVEGHEDKLKDTFFRINIY